MIRSRSLLILILKFAHINNNFNTLKNIKYTLLVTWCLSLVGCFESSLLDRWIDNPAINEIKLTIDGNELTIPAQSGIEYKFDYGKHTLTYNNDSLNFIVKPAKFGTTSFINSTQSNYFINTVVYSTSNVSQESMIKFHKKSSKIFLLWLMVNKQK